MAEMIAARSGLCAEVTSVMQSAVAVFLCTTVPRRDLLFTMAHGTPIFLQSAGSHRTSSMGSTSWAMTTSFAFFASTSAVTWLIPNLTTVGFGPCSTLSPPAAFSASKAIRVFLAAVVSGRCASLCHEENTST